VEIADSPALARVRMSKMMLYILNKSLSSPVVPPVGLVEEKKILKKSRQYNENKS
jgi:hypothetical protein